MEENEKKDRKLGIIVLILVIVMFLFGLCCCGGIAAGILAPQYLKYVEKTKISSDSMMVKEVFTMAEVIASDPDTSALAGTDFVVRVDVTGDITVTDQSGIRNTAFEQELFKQLGYDQISLQSNQHRMMSSSCVFQKLDNGRWSKSEAGSINF